MALTKKKKTLLFALLGVVLLVFVLFTILVKVCDVQKIGPDASEVGFATMNKQINDLVKPSKAWDIVTDVIMYLALASMVGIMIQGIVQCVKRKSFIKIDKEILIYGIAMVLLIGFYAAFEIAIINYRPILVDGKLESSYPSTHTMITTFATGANILFVGKYIKNKKFFVAGTAIGTILVLLVMVGRVLSGNHWITDVIGGFFAGTLLLSVYFCGTQIFIQPGVDTVEE